MTQPSRPTMTWDREVKILRAEVLALKRSGGIHGSQGSEAITLRRERVTLLRAQLEKTLDQIERLAQRRALLLPRERTVLHWAAIFAQKARRYLEMRHDLFNLSMWLRLIAVRLDSQRDTDDTRTNLCADDVVDLSLKHKQLIKTERLLKESLRAAKKEDFKLRRRYEYLMAAHANRIAAGTMHARLGQNAVDAMLGAYTQQLNLLLRQAEAVTYRERFESRAPHAHSQKTQKLADISERLILESVVDPATKPNPRTVRKVQTTFADLDRIEARFERDFDEYLQRSSPLPGPKVISPSS